MNTVFAPPRSTQAFGDAAQPYIYSFRCSQGMEDCLSRLMHERGLSRSSVIRLALYALDCYTRRREVQELPLSELIGAIESLASDAHMSFAEFVHGK